MRRALMLPTSLLLLAGHAVAAAGGASESLRPASAAAERTLAGSAQPLGVESMSTGPGHHLSPTERAMLREQVRTQWQLRRPAGLSSDGAATSGYAEGEASASGR